MENYRVHKLILLRDLDGLKAELQDYSAENPCPEINQLDLHGQTPLTLAIMTGFNEAIPVLLDNGASSLEKNSAGWSPFQESTSYGNREVMAELLRRQKDELVEWFKEKGQKACKAFSNSLEDFYIEMNWKFDSWIPLLNKLCPSDNYKIWKKGTSVRIDTTLVGFENLKWIIGDISVIFYVDEETGEPQLYIVDRIEKKYQKILPRSEIPMTDKSLEEAISINLKTPIVSNPRLPIEKLKLTRSTSGWWNKEDKFEKIGKYYTSVWNLSNVEIHTLTRNEHVTEIKKLEKEKEMKLRAEKMEMKKKDMEQREENLMKKLAMNNNSSNVASDEMKNNENKSNGSISTTETATNGKNSETNSVNGKEECVQEKTLDETLNSLEITNKKEASNEEVEAYVNNVKESWNVINSFVYLPPPPPSSILFEDYFFLLPPGYLHLGRKQEIDESKLKFKATLWISNEESSRMDPEYINSRNSSIPQTPFPMKIEQLYPILDILGFGSNEHISTLREVLNATLPDGFPVQIEIPVFNLFYALISFDNYTNNVEVGEDHFAVPFDEYKPGVIISKLAEEDEKEEDEKEKEKAKEETNKETPINNN